jgi:hypothetical protein
MHFRPPEEQNQHKVTCGVAVSALQRVQDAIQGRLDAARVKANIITSGTGVCLPGLGGSVLACVLACVPVRLP